MITYLLAVIFTAACIVYAKYQFEDEKAGWAFSKGKWHVSGALQRSLFFAAMLFHHNWQDIFLSGAICVILFEMGINVYALHVKPFYTGNTSSLDKSIGKKKWVAMGGLLAGAIAVKMFIH